MLFTDYIEKHLSLPFEWGKNDCITFAIGWLSIASDQNLLADIPEWNTKREAYNVVQSVGGLYQIFHERLRPIKPTTAHNGDLTLIKNTVFLFFGSHIVAPGEKGLVFQNREIAKCAWSL